MLVFISALNQHMVFLNDEKKYKFLTIKIHFENEFIIINNQKILMQHEKSITYSHEDITYFICFSIYHKNYQKYVRYKLPHHYLTIGNKIDYDICIQDKNLNNPIIFDLIEKKYEYKNSHVNYYDGKVFEIINLRFTIHDDFIMINQPQNIFINLPKYDKFIKYQKPNFQDLNLYKSRFKSYSSLKPLKITLDKPDNIPTYEPMPLALLLIPSILMSCASLINGILMTYNALLNQRKIIEIIPMLIMPLCMVLSSCLVIPLQRRFEKNRHLKKISKRNNNFRKMLNDKVEIINEYKNTYIKNIEERFYVFSTLYNKAKDSDNILWSKTSNNDDFLKIMLGKGIYDIEIKYNDIKIEQEDSLYSIYSEFIYNLTKIETYYLFDLKKYKVLALVNEDNLLEYIILQLVVYFHPDDLKLCIICTKDYLNKHNYLRFIPHLNHQNKRCLICNQDNLKKIKDLEDSNNTVIINCNSNLKINVPNLVINVYDYLNDVDNYNEAIITKDKLIFKDKTFQEYIYNQANLNLEQLFLKINNIYQKDNKIKEEIGIFDLLSINTLDDIDIQNNWENNQTYEGISQIVGFENNDKPIILDLATSKQGPHGIIAGSTGSGKSELIISYFMALCSKYHPSQLQLMIIDFKGGGLIQAFSNRSYHIPHLVQTMTNLNKTEIKRCLINLHNECQKRQRYFKRMANILNMTSMDIDKYQQYHDQQNELPYLAHLIIIVDEFAELKQKYFDFISQLISISRIGRSLGIHLILATQKPKGVVDEQIFANSHFIICLKMQNKEDSMEMLNNDLAYKLKQAGEFILSYDDIQIHGKGGYGLLPYDYSFNKNKVQILDEMKNIIKEKAFNNTKTKTQLEYIANKICSAKLDNEINPLYNNPLKLISSEEIIYYRQKGILLGVIDDFYMNKQYYLYHNKKPLLAIIASKIKQQEFIEMYMYNLLRIKNPYQLEVYIIDDGMIINDLYIKSLWFEFINTEEEINYFFEKILKNKKEKMIIFTNINRFCTNYENKIMQIYDMLANYELYNLRILFINNSSNTINSKILNLMSERISIDIKEKNELFNIFSTNKADELDLDNTYGLYFNKHVLPFININIDNFEKDRLFKEIRYSKQHKIKTMPNRLLLTKIIKGCLLIGKSYKDLENIIISNYPLLVLASNPHCLNKFENLCLKQNILFSKDLNMKAKVYIINAQEYQRLNDTKYYPYRLWIGPGFKNQYIFNLMIKEDLNINQGILEFQGNFERIKICQ